MTLGTKLRHYTTKVGQKAHKIATLADKVGRMPLIGGEAKEVAHYAHIAEAVAQDVGDIGRRTGTFQAGGKVSTAKQHAGDAIKDYARGGVAGVAGGLVGRGYAHLATHHIGSGAKLLHQAHEQVRSRDVVAEGGRLTRSAGHHLRRFQR